MRVYSEKRHMHTIETPGERVKAMRFGRYSREDNTVSLSLSSLLPSFLHYSCHDHSHQSYSGALAVVRCITHHKQSNLSNDRTTE